MFCYELSPKDIQLLSLGAVVWHTFKARTTQRGELWIRFAALRVWRLENEVPHPQAVCLLIRQELDTSETKFSLGNAPETIPIEALRA